MSELARKPLTLLQQAKMYNVKRREKFDTATDEEMALAIAFLSGEISVAQVAYARNCPMMGSHYGWAFRLIRQAIKAGKVKLEKAP